MDHKNYLNNNMNLNQILKITGSVSLVTLLAFSQNGIKAEESEKPNVVQLDEEILTINYGDTKTIAELSKTTLKSYISELSELVEIEKTTIKTVYEIEEYIVTVHLNQKSGLGIKEAKLTIESKLTHSRKDDQKIIVSNEFNSKFIEGAVNEYIVKVKIQDNQAPTIECQNDISIMDADSFDINDYISVKDNVDENVSYDVEGSLTTKNNLYVPGTYTFVISSTDASGNTSSKEVSVTVEKTPVKDVSSYYYKNADTSNFLGNEVVLSAAYSQLGRYQDCTALVSNSLASAGVYFRGWPAEYFALGHTVSYSEARPGDIIYYANGGTGVPHVAIYIGNGQAIHGGWNGYNTIIYDAFVGSGQAFIRISK